MVQVVVECGKNKERFRGVVKDAGRDFLSLNTREGKTFIPYQVICSVNHDQEHLPHHHHPELVNINRKLRRKLVLHFGEVVSQSPSLINLFFGISLHLFLLCFASNNIRVGIGNQQTEIVKGTLIDSEEEHIELEMDGVKQTIDFDDICFIQIVHKDEAEEFMEE